MGNDGVAEAAAESGEMAWLAEILILDMLLRIYVSNSARAESVGQRKNGKKVGNAYIVIVILMILISTAALVAYMVFEKSQFTGYIDIAVTFVVEVTSIVTMIEMIRDAFIIRSLRKEAVR